MAHSTLLPDQIGRIKGTEELVYIEAIYDDGTKWYRVSNPVDHSKDRRVVEAFKVEDPYESLNCEAEDYMVCGASYPMGK